MYDTSGRLTRHDIIPGEILIWITRRILNQNQKYFNPLVTGQWPIGHWSPVALVGSNFEKNVGRNTRWTLPLRKTFIKSDPDPQHCSFTGALDRYLLYGT